MMTCQYCDADVTGHNFCPSCGRVVDRERLIGLTIQGFRGPASLNPKVQKFWRTGDPSVFAKPGALDYVGP
jgi:hypothetical protein